MKHCLITAIMLFELFSFSGCMAQQNNFKSVNNQEFAERLATNSYILIDVRTPTEFATEHIPGAINIDVNADNFSEQIKSFDKKRPMAIYCRSGKRSKKAALILSKLGYQGIELNTGILNWNGPSEK